MSNPLRILSLGAGVQSTALLLMSIKGILPRIDHAIFADTQYEPPAVYTHLAWLEEQAKAAGIPLHKVTAGNLRVDALGFRERAEVGTRRASLPVFIRNPDGSRGIVRRQCTSVYKIEPIERFIRRNILSAKPGGRIPKDAPKVDQWFGITSDEIQRMRDSRETWQRNVYPFCGKFGDDMLPRSYSRQDCLAWLREHYPDRHIPRSACIACPFRRDHEWRAMKDNDPESWADAVRFDEEMRAADWSGQGKRKILVGLPFLHDSLKPLGEVDLSTDIDRG